MKEHIKASEKIQLSDEEIANLSDAEFKTLVGNQDAHRNYWVQMQNKGRSESYTKRNKEKYTGNQQLREGNWDSNQQFGTEGRKKHSARMFISKKWGEAQGPLGQL